MAGVISNLIKGVGGTTGFVNPGSSSVNTSTAAYPFSGRTANTPSNIAYGGSPTIPTGGPTNTQPATTFQTPQPQIPYAPVQTVAPGTSTGTGTQTPQYSGFNSLNGQPISATNPQATSSQLQANLAAGKGYGSTPPVTQPTPAPGVGTTLFPGLTQTLAGTQPNTSTQTAIGNSNNISMGGTTVNPLTPQQQQNQNNVNTGAQVSGNIAQNQTPNVLAAEKQYQQVAANPFMQGALQNSAMAENVSAGAGQQFATNYANQLSNANQNVQNALTGQGQQLTGANQQAGIGQSAQNAQLTGANQAGQLANTAQSNQIGAQSSALQAVQPQLGAYGQTYYQPGQAGTTQGGGNLDPQTQATSLAQQVINGTMSLQQAQQSMGYAGSAGTTFLNNAITAANPNFNFNQAQQNAQAQGTIGPQAATATEAINQLQSAMQSAPWYQTTGIPAINALSGLLSTVGLGTGSQANINDARNEAVQTATSVLGTAYSSAGQTTPTSLTSLVQSWFPPNPTPSQVQAGVQQFNQRLASITSSFTSPGTVPLPSNTSTNGTPNPGFGWNGQ